MIERQTRKSRRVSLEYEFDRLHPAKLQQVYEILVPDQVRAVGCRSSVMGGRDEDSCDLRKSFLRQAKG